VSRTPELRSDKLVFISADTTHRIPLELSRWIEQIKETHRRGERRAIGGQFWSTDSDYKPRENLLVGCAKQRDVFVQVTAQTSRADCNKA
jgi:hypothetical protein